MGAWRIGGARQAEATELYRAGNNASLPLSPLHEHPAFLVGRVVVDRRDRDAEHSEEHAELRAVVDEVVQDERAVHEPARLGRMAVNVASQPSVMVFSWGLKSSRSIGTRSR